MRDNKRDGFIKMLGGEIIETSVEPFNRDALSDNFIKDLNKLMAHYDISSQELEGIIKYHSAKPTAFRKE